MGFYPHTISSISLVIVLIAIISSLVLQVLSYIRIDKIGSSNDKPSELDTLYKNAKSAQQQILYSIIGSSIAIVVSMILGYLLFSSVGDVPFLVNIGLTILTILLFINGIYSAIAATKLQCLRSNKNINIIWKYTTSVAVIGIVGPMLILIVKGYKQVDIEKLRNKICPSQIPYRPNY